MARITIYQVKLEKVKSYNHDYDTKTIRMPSDAADIIRHYFENYCSTDRENFIAMFLNTKNRITGISTIHVGSLDASIVHPREVYTEALLHKSAAIIVCHNHPSGVTTPSQEDISITKTLQQAGDVLGISLLDHIILGENTHYSLREGGYM